MLCEKCDLAECTCWCAGCNLEPSTCVCGWKPEDFVTSEEKQATRKMYDQEDLEHIDLLRSKTLEYRQMVALYIMLTNAREKEQDPTEMEDIAKKLDRVYHHIGVLDFEIKAIIGTHFL